MEKTGNIDSALETLFGFIAEDYEELLHFGKRMRKEFDADDTAGAVESDIVVPTIPDSCDESTKAARDSLQKLKDAYDDCLSYLEWINRKLNE